MKNESVVIINGKPQLYKNGSDVQRGVPTKEELESVDGIIMFSKTTKLPDDLEGGEEIDISIKNKKRPKSITRVDV